MSRTMWNWMLVAVVVLASLMAAALSVWWASSREVVTPMTALSTTGAQGRALLVYHPGLSDFPDRITAAFADGLAQLRRGGVRHTPSAGVMRRLRPPGR